MVPKLSIQDGIDAGKRFFKKLYIDKTKCADFLEAVPQYTREYDEERKIFKDTPLHDWTSHFSDEHRYASLVETLFINESEVTEAEKADRLLSRLRQSTNQTR